MLKFMEMLHLIEDESGPRHPQMEADAKELARILNLFRSGVLIMDEVDLILHPLKSELNFPIGPKLDLDFAPLRWKLPIHLLDAVFYADGGSLSVGFKESNRAFGVLEKLKEVVIEGYKQRALQRNPHIVLLNPDYYHKYMKPIIAQWALLWLESQNLTGTSLLSVLLHPEVVLISFSSICTGLNDQQIIQYILEDDRSNYEQELVDFVNNTLSPKNKKMLNLTRDWLKSFLPHVLQKVPTHHGLATVVASALTIVTFPSFPNRSIVCRSVCLPRPTSTGPSQSIPTCLARGPSSLFLSWARMSPRSLLSAYPFIPGGAQMFPRLIAFIILFQVRSSRRHPGSHRIGLPL
jgi:hypothetical protein